MLEHNLDIVVLRLVSASLESLPVKKSTNHNLGYTRLAHIQLHILLGLGRIEGIRLAVRHIEDIRNPGLEPVLGHNMAVADTDHSHRHTAGIAALVGTTGRQVEKSWQLVEKSPFALGPGFAEDCSSSSAASVVTDYRPALQGHLPKS